MEKNYGLCHRCELRAIAKEENHGPRYECKLDWAVHSCYMYKPVKPFVMKPNDGDNRPAFSSPILSARSHAVGPANMVLKIKEVKNGSVLYWDFENSKEGDK